MTFKANGKKGSDGTSVIEVMIEKKKYLKKSLNKQKARIIFLNENGSPTYLHVQQMPRILIILFLLEPRAAESKCSFHCNAQRVTEIQLHFFMRLLDCNFILF